MKQRQPREQSSDGRRLGILVGGSGFIGGTILHYFKTVLADEFEVLAPNSKKLSLREPDDIRRYFRKYRPAFIINSAVAAIDSDPKLAYEVNYLGAINLARVAMAFNVPCIHISTAAVLPEGEGLSEADHLPLAAGLPNYPKSKLMAELTLEELGRRSGLDYTTIRLAVVYGEHDHKIHGFTRLLFTVANQAMPVMLTRPGVRHSYSNARKLPHFVHHALMHRDEFGGKTYHFVDPQPVELASLVVTLKDYMELSVPKQIYIPYPLARLGQRLIQGLVRALGRIGVEARMPAELMFMEHFYKSQTLAADKAVRSSFVDQDPEATIFTEIPALIQYYLTRWEMLNLIEPFDKEFFDPKRRAEEFLRSPEVLLDAIHRTPPRPRPEAADPFSLIDA